MESRFKGIYDRSPVLLQNLAVTGFSLWLDRQRYGGRFKTYRAFLEESQWYSATQLQAYQEEQLRRLVQHVFVHVPFYRAIMNERGLVPADIQTIDDLAKLPLLTKEIIRKNFSDLLSDEFDINRVTRGNTSGTTGSPLEICYSPKLINFNYAMLDRQYQWVDTRLGVLGDKVAVLRGNVIVPLEQEGPPFWRINFAHRQMLLSAFHLSSENLPLYIDALQRFQPRVLDGYPSTLYVLAKHLMNENKKMPLHAVLSSSETLYDFQRETIEDSFQCRVFDYFGSAERVIFATECDQHVGRHVCSEYGITETLGDSEGAGSSAEGGVLVGTSLHNYAMPMLRYVTNDRSRLRTDACACGRELPLMDDITTKAEDSLTLPDGRILSPSVLTHPFKPLTTIEASQIVQESRDSIIVYIVPGDNFVEEHAAQLAHGLQERVGDEVSILIETVDVLQRSRAGKFKWVISHVEPGI